MAFEGGSIPESGINEATGDSAAGSEADRRGAFVVVEEQMRFPEVKERKTAHDLADMIRRDLSGVAGCPTNGVNVTVYGLNPWNALLMFDASAGPVPNSKEVRRLFDVITDRLKRLYYIES